MFSYSFFHFERYKLELRDIFYKNFAIVFIVDHTARGFRAFNAWHRIIRVLFCSSFCRKTNRVINRAPGLKLVVQTLLSSLRPIGNIVLICCTFFIIFGILGVQVMQ